MEAVLVPACSVLLQNKKISAYAKPPPRPGDPDNTDYIGSALWEQVISSPYDDSRFKADYVSLMKACPPR